MAKMHFLSLVVLTSFALSAEAQLVTIPASVSFVKPEARPTPRGNAPLTVGRPIPAPDGASLAIGMGYNALTNEFIPNVCVAGSAPSIKFGAGELAGTIDRKRIVKIENMADHQAASGSDVGFDFAYKLVSVGFASGTSSSSFYNSIDQYARIYVRVTTEGEALLNPVWAERGKTYSSGKLSTFTDKCGTHYVRALYKGHLLDQTYRFATNTASISSASKNDLSFGVGKIFGLDYSDTNNLTKINANSSMNIEEESRGIGTTVSKPADASALVAIVKFADEEFALKARSAPKSSAVNVMMELAPYRTVPQSNGIPSWPNDVMGYLVSRAGTFQTLATSMGDLDFAANLPESRLTALYYDDTATVTKKRSDALALRDAVAIAAKNCRKMLVDGIADNVAISGCETQLGAAIDPSKVAQVKPRAR
jgi:hypothetical protein